ncbi:MAG TPA: glycosyltransferase family 4 protein [Gemmatimonadales bacterium]|nr:glycosyltransferase family 4 protein [Gemmatimonadales bacterium]
MQVLHQGGGAGSVSSTLHLSLGLQRAGFQVKFVCPPGSEVESQARAGGLEVHPVRLDARRRLRNASRLNRLLQDHPVDIVNSQSSRDRAALSWLALTGRLHAPLVVTRRQMPRTLAPGNWLVSRLAARVVAVSPAVANALVRRGTSRRKLAVIPNGLITSRVDAPVTPADLDEWRRRIRWEPSRRTIGIVARLKDQAVVLRALDQVATPVRLVLAGVGPESELRRFVRQVPERHAVVQLPFADGVRPLYDLLEIALLPSRIEGLSQALLEAMALGKPVIASAAAGNLDLISDRVNGLLVEPLDSNRWAQAITELMTNSGLAARMAAAARDTARNRYALQRTVQATAELYRTVLAMG